MNLQRSEERMILRTGRYWGSALESEQTRDDAYQESQDNVHLRKIILRNYPRPTSLVFFLAVLLFTNFLKLS